MLIFTDTDKVLYQRSSKNKHNGQQLLDLLTQPDVPVTLLPRDDHPSPVSPGDRKLWPKSDVTSSPLDQIHFRHTPTPPQPSLPAQCDHVTNITVLGEPGCGKTSLIQRLVSGTFSRKYEPTYGADTTLLYLSYKNSQPCYFRFLSTNDVILDPSMAVTLEERADALHARFSDCVIIVYDVADHKSFEATRDWLRLVHGFLHNTDARLILVGSKADQARRRQVHTTAGETLAALTGMNFLEVSALSEQNIHRLFLYIGGLS